MQPYKLKYILAIAERTAMAVLAVAMLASCSSSGSDEPGSTPAETERPMTFSVIANTPSSRADTPLSDIYRRFGVWCWKTGADNAETDVMSHADGTPYEVVSTTDGWIYDFVTTDAVPYTQYLKYWDLTAKQYDFMAFAPYRIPDADGGTNVTDMVEFNHTTRTFRIPALAANVAPALAPQWLVAHTRRVATASGTYDYDMYRSAGVPIDANGVALTSNVPLRFRYLAPVIELRTYNTDGVDVSALNFDISLVKTDGVTPNFVTTKATLEKKASDATYTLTPSSDTADRSSDIFHEAPGEVITIKGLDPDGTDRDTKATVVYRLVELPLTLDGADYNFNIRITTVDETEYEGVLPLSGNWEPGKRYIYYIIISAERDIILMDLDIADFFWQPGNDIDPDGDIDNW